MSHFNQALMISGIGQYHTNEADPENPNKKLTPYLTITWDEILELVYNPQQVDKSHAQWFIPSVCLSRSFRVQEERGKFYFLWADLDDKNTPTLEDLINILENMDGFYYGWTLKNCAIYSSRSATQYHQKTRILIPLSEPLNGGDWIMAQQTLNDKLQALGVNADRATERTAQLCYLPNKGEFYNSISFQDGSYLCPLKDWAKEIQDKRDELIAQEIELEKATQEFKQKRENFHLNNKMNPIVAFNQLYTPQELLKKAGYANRGNSFRHPNSQSGSYSASVRMDGKGVLRVNTLSTSDPLYVQGSKSAHDSFSVFEVLFHGGDQSKALKDAGDSWLFIDGESFNKVAQRQYMQEKSAQEIFDSFDVELDEEIISTLESESQKTASNPFPLPFEGIMTKAVNNALECAHKPQPALTTLAILVGMASALSGNFHLSDGTRLNLYGLGVAETGEGKEMVGRTAENAAYSSGALLLGKPASGQGLEDALVDTQGMLIRVDEVGHMLQSMNHAKAAPYSIELNENLLKLYSCGSGRYATRIKANSKGTKPPRVLNNPCLSFIGFTTPAALAKGLSLANIEQGLLGRFLFVEGERGVNQRRANATLQINNELFDAFKLELEFNDDLTNFSNTEVLESPEATVKLDELMTFFGHESTKADTPEARALLKRSYEKVVRIAGVLAVWDEPFKPVISVAHINWAEKLVRYSNEALLNFAANKIHDNEQLADASKVFDVIEKINKGDIKVMTKASRTIRSMNPNWIAKSAVLSSSKLSKDSFDKAISYLDAVGKIGEGTYHNSTTSKNISYLFMEDS